MDEQVVAKAIRAARESRGVSLRTMAADLGLSPAALRGVERGLTPLTLSRLEQIAEALDVPAAQLLTAPAAQASETRANKDGPNWRTFDDLWMDPVLDTATRLFVRQGYHATSMRAIASEAGLSVAGVYHHYRSKEQILVALLDLTMNELTWRLEAARLDGDDPVESFALMVEALALFHAVRGDLAFIGASEMRAFSPEERTRITALRDDIQHSLDRQALLCADAGRFTADDLRTATRAIATMCTSLPSWFRLDGPLSATQVARRYADYALALIVHGGGRPTA